MIARAGPVRRIAQVRTFGQPNPFVGLATH